MRLLKKKKIALGKWILQQLSNDLIAEFPEKGFSYTNIKILDNGFILATTCGRIQDSKANNLWAKVVLKIRNNLFQFDEEKKPTTCWQNFDDTLGTQYRYYSKCKTIEEAIYYVQNTIKNGISRNVLIHQIETNLYERDGKAITNFEATLPPFNQT